MTLFKAVQSALGPLGGVAIFRVAIQQRRGRVHMPSARLLVDTGGVAVPVGKALGDLGTSNPGCIAFN